MNSDTKTLTTITLRELKLCVSANRLTRMAAAAVFFTIISRLGNGIFWCALILSLPLIFGPAAIPAFIHTSLTAFACALLYWSLKGFIRRPRPYHYDGEIKLGALPLDEFSFPSGHTLQAVAISIVSMAWFPILAWVLIPFTVLVAISRVVLGLHYPSDVLAAAIIGAGVAAASLGLYRVWLL